MKKAIIIFLSLSCCLILNSSVSNLAFAQSTSQIFTPQHKQLTQEEAKELLLKFNNKIDYIYQGDASKFKALKEKNLQGYVFLPNVDTDIGYFVDKNTCSIYYFHPSGYLELVGDIKD